MASLLSVRHGGQRGTEAASRRGGRAGAERGGCRAASQEQQTQDARAVVVLKRCESQAANPVSSAASIQTCQLLPLFAGDAWREQRSALEK